mmetsp:Transcript_23970/g.68649  ORF Transcript_23970/g.68649 Transcript_23970/m.68649 type:complete len:218 (+) Transcript_23970:509-1162(+)
MPIWCKSSSASTWHMSHMFRDKILRLSMDCGPLRSSRIQKAFCSLWCSTSCQTWASGLPSMWLMVGPNSPLFHNSSASSYAPLMMSIGVFASHVATPRRASVPTIFSRASCMDLSSESLTSKSLPSSPGAICTTHWRPGSLPPSLPFPLPLAPGPGECDALAFSSAVACTILSGLTRMEDRPGIRACQRPLSAWNFISVAICPFRDGWELRPMILTY